MVFLFIVRLAPNLVKSSGQFHVFQCNQNILKKLFENLTFIVWSLESDSSSSLEVSSHNVWLDWSWSWNALTDRHIAAGTVHYNDNNWAWALSTAQVTNNAMNETQLNCDITLFHRFAPTVLQRRASSQFGDIPVFPTILFFWNAFL